jgi:hypothetical protein
VRLTYFDKEKKKDSPPILSNYILMYLNSLLEYPSVLECTKPSYYSIIKLPAFVLLILLTVPIRFDKNFCTLIWFCWPSFSVLQETIHIYLNTLVENLSTTDCDMESESLWTPARRHKKRKASASPLNQVSYSEVVQSTIKKVPQIPKQINVNSTKVFKYICIVSCKIPYRNRWLTNFHRLER